MYCTPVIAPEHVLALLEPNQQIKFVGSYDVTKRNIQNNGITSTVPTDISVNPAGYNLREVQSFKLNDLNLPDINFLNETYSITSWKLIPLTPLNKILGEINFTGLYDNGNQSGTVTGNSVQKFNVNSSSGIYLGITNVIIDFTNNPRVVYFIGDF